MEGVYLKPDPETAGASPPTDDDIYEDTGDLEFNTDPNYQNLYLARIPKYLWKEWSELDDDTEIQLGTVRITTTKNADGTTKQNMGMLLRPDLPFHKQVPKEYDLNVSSGAVKNTYIFSEQDLPGFKSKTRMKFDPASANMPARLTRPQPDRSQRGNFDKEKQRFVPYVKKIPKKTVLAGTVKHEINCAPVQNAESDRILAERTLAEMKPKAVTKRVKGVNQLSNGYVHHGTAGATNSFGGFIKTGKAAKQDNRTARIAQNEILDKIFAIFREFKYVSMKSFRERLRQPEAYIRETLEPIADLAKSGTFAMLWSLKPENVISGSDMYASDGVAPPAAPGGMDGADDTDMDMDGDDDDEDNMKMEDVL